MLSKSDHLEQIVAQHEAFFQNLAHVSDSPDVKLWILSQWDPWHDRYSAATADGSEIRPGLLHDISQSLSQLREQASQRGVAVPDLSAAAPGVAHAHDQLAADVEADINRKTNDWFWHDTGYKVGQKLDPKDPQDAKMIPIWISMRYETALAAARHADPNQSFARIHSDSLPASTSGWLDDLKGAALDPVSSPREIATKAVWNQLALDAPNESPFYAFYAFLLPRQSDRTGVASFLSEGQARSYMSSLKTKSDLLYAALFTLGASAPELVDEVIPALPRGHMTTQVSGGNCGARTFANVSHQALDRILARLREKGADVSGSNPWTVVTHDHGVELTGSWDESTMMLKLEVTDSDFVAPCSAVWSALDDMLAEVGAVAASTTIIGRAGGGGGGGRGFSYNRGRGFRTYGSGWGGWGGDTANVLIDVGPVDEVDFTDPDEELIAIAPVASSGSSELCAGWWDDLTGAVSNAVNGIEHAASAAVGTIGHTLVSLKGPIATAAKLAASAAASKIPGVGQAIAPMAENLANGLVNAAVGSGSVAQAAHAVVAQASQLAQIDPRVAKALDIAHQAVAKSTIAHHVAQTVANAAAGNQSAQKQIVDLAKAAAHGDPAAQDLTSLAHYISSAVSDNASTSTMQDIDPSLIEMDSPDGSDATSSGATLCGGWFDSITHAVSSAVKSATHYAMHPSDIARDVAGHLGAGKALSNALSYVTDPLQDVTENPMVQQAAAGYFGGPAGVAALQAAKTVESGGLDLSNVGSTLKRFAPQIAAAAQNAAGAQGGPAAASLAGAIVNAAAGKGGAANLAQKFVSAASRNPRAASALNAAHHAVTQATAGYHAAQTAARAAAGDPSAHAQLNQLSSDAAHGDPAAQQTVSTMQDIDPNLIEMDPAVSSGASAALSEIAARTAAAEHVKGARVVGVVIGSPGNPLAQGVMHFHTTDDADDWFGSIASQPSAFGYLAYYDAADPTWPSPLNEAHGRATAAASAQVSGLWPLLLAGGAGAAAGAYFWPAVKAKVDAMFHKAA